MWLSIKGIKKELSLAVKKVDEDMDRIRKRTYAAQLRSKDAKKMAYEVKEDLALCQVRHGLGTIKQ